MNIRDTDLRHEKLEDEMMTKEDVVVYMKKLSDIHFDELHLESLSFEMDTLIMSANYIISDKIRDIDSLESIKQLMISENGISLESATDIMDSYIEESFKIGEMDVREYIKTLYSRLAEFVLLCVSKVVNYVQRFIDYKDIIGQQHLTDFNRFIEMSDYSYNQLTLRNIKAVNNRTLIKDTLLNCYTNAITSAFESIKSIHNIVNVLGKDEDIGEQYVRMAQELTGKFKRGSHYYVNMAFYGQEKPQTYDMFATTIIKAANVTSFINVNNLMKEKGYEMKIKIKEFKKTLDAFNKTLNKNKNNMNYCKAMFTCYHKINSVYMHSSMEVMKIQKYTMRLLIPGLKSFNKYKDFEDNASPFVQKILKGDKYNAK